MTMRDPARPLALVTLVALAVSILAQTVDGTPIPWYICALWLIGCVSLIAREALL